MTEVRFFGIKGKYGSLSNFAPSPLTIGGKSYSTSEHYFQSVKFVETDPAWAETVRLAPTPLECKKLGRTRDRPISRGWTGQDGGLSVVVMKRVLFAKAFQDKVFRETLTNIPKDAKIIEASPYDAYWGEGRDRNGKNMLGVLLMELRDILVKCKNDMYVLEG